MALAIIYDGPALVRVTGTGSTLGDFAYTADGVRVTQNPFYYQVPGDQNGGSDGPPIDLQILGETADITLDITKFDTTQMGYICSFINGGTSGVVPTSGTLMFQEAKTFRVLIVPTLNSVVTRPLNFPRCIVNPVELNKGVKFTRPFLSFTAHKDDSGILFNATTT